MVETKGITKEIISAGGEIFANYPDKMVLAGGLQNQSKLKEFQPLLREFQK